MTEKERDAILLSLKEDVSGLKDDVSSLKEDVSGLKNDVSKLQDNVSKLQDNVSKLQENVSKLNEDSESFSRSIAVIEYDHGNKIQAILDVISENPIKFESIDKRFESDEKKLDNHSLRILNLESKASNQ